jgi:hypothetical protein
MEYSKAKKGINPSTENDPENALGEFQINARMQDNVWWLI